MALSFIGKPISLISHSDVRYRGILAGIDPAASTIQLSNVFSMGTESRRPMNEYIPPVQEPYQYIIFRASEVKDLSVDEPPPSHRNIHDDPAVIGASAQAAQPVVPAAAPTYAQQTGQQIPQQQQQQQQPRAAAPRHRPNAAPQTQNQTAINNAAASLESVERALGDLRVSGGRRQRTRRPHDAPVPSGGVSVPAVDFDFASMNAKFDKAALAARSVHADGGSDRTNPSDDDDAKDKSAYNPQKSFFDSLSSPPIVQRGGGPGGRGRARGRGGFNRREEERERNVATFGEPGGVGLLGPGAYVGGWGGRRGGGRRRGPGRPQQQQQQAQ
ncbi:Scd6-like Sm domain-containing protein [Mycena amicta]|nr:Scd6-like Sm domain-containing protein [Mycena amicta]